jgi:hypothetical protein
MTKETAAHFIGHATARALCRDAGLYEQAIGRAWERGDSHRLEVLRALRAGGI